MAAAPGSLDRYLADEEFVVLAVRRHIAALLKPFVATAAVILIASAVGAAVSPDTGADFVDALVGYVVLGFVVWFLWVTLQWAHDRVVVTDQRIFQVSGIFTRRVASMPLTKVTDMTYQRTLAGRTLGFGDLILETAGQEQALGHILFLPAPDHFYRTVTSLVSARMSPGRAPYRGRHSTSFRPPDQDDTGPLPRVV